MDNPADAVRDAVVPVEKLLAFAEGDEDIAAAMTFVWTAAEEVLSSPSLPSVRVACGPGCPECCRVNVAVLVPEAVAIAATIRRAEVAQAADTAGRLADFAGRVRWMDHAERLRCRLSCPFLDGQGRCTIHPVRPLMCRSITSTDADVCRRSLEAAAWDEEELVTMDLSRKLVYEEAYLALADSLGRLGLDTRSVELTRAVGALLRRPDLVAEFLSGVRIDWDEALSAPSRCP